MARRRPRSADEGVGAVTPPLFPPRPLPPSLFLSPLLPPSTPLALSSDRRR